MWDMNTKSSFIILVGKKKKEFTITENNAKVNLSQADNRYEKKGQLQNYIVRENKISYLSCVCILLAS